MHSPLAPERCDLDEREGRERVRLVVLAAGRGLRLRAESGDRAKILLDVGGRTILERLVELAADLGLDPLVVTRREFADDIGRTAEVLVEDEPTEFMESFYFSRVALHETFCWMGGDMLFSDPRPLRDLLADHIGQGCACSFFYSRGDRFKAKIRLSPTPRVEVTREGTHEWSIPNFVVQEPRLFADMPPGRRADYLQKAIDRGDPVLFREYEAPVFEIDTPADLAQARLFFAFTEPRARQAG
jgi:NDP-sugar pyrophosphorylase family protein